MSDGRATTRDRLLTIAGRLFADHGFDRGSVRQVTDGAGANLAAINYHFGSKEALYREVLMPRLRALNQERLTLLADAGQLAGDQPVPVAAVLDTFIRPLIRQASAPEGRHFLRMLRRDLAHPPPFLGDELAAEVEPVMERYRQALAQALPDLSSVDLAWRMHFTLGAVLSAAGRRHEDGQIPPDSDLADDRGDLVRRLVDFCAAGFSRPSATEAP